jgi:ubiquinone/menaquinone biosynthesis C-methylase UbiE
VHAAHAAHAAAAGAAQPTALDLATGSGRDAVWLALQGHATWGLDLLPDALERARLLADATARVRAAAGAPSLAPLAFVRADATRMPPFRDGAFDLVCVFRYLDRARFGAIARLVAPGGALVCETFTVEQARFGRPKRPEFLLEPGELERLCEDAGLEVLAGGESVAPDGPALASVRARRLTATRTTGSLAL